MQKFNMGNSDYVTVPIAVGGNSGAVPQMTQFTDRGDLIEKIKPEFVVEIIRQKLLGKEFINGQWIDVPALKDRRLTEVGAWELANIMLGTSTISVSISKFKERRINDRAFNITRSAILMMLENWRRYGIQTVSHFYYISEILFSNTIAVLSQAEGGSIQELLKGTVKGSIGDPYMTPHKEGVSRKIGRMLGLVGN